MIFFIYSPRDIEYIHDTIFFYKRLINLILIRRLRHLLFLHQFSTSYLYANIWSIIFAAWNIDRKVRFESF